MSNEDIKKVAIYTRVSTEEQAREGFSLEAQLERLRAYCLAREWEISREYTDPGFSGRNIRRPQYKQMMEDIDKWDAILVIKMDRIHRHQKNFISMMEGLRRQDKQFVSMQESLDTSTAMGRFVMTSVIQGIAQLESEVIGERVAAALYQKAKKAEKFMGHRTAFGIDWDKDKQIFKPDQKRLEIVKQVYQMYLDGFSMREIAKKLSPDYKKLASKDLANTTVKYFLHNCMYCGVERWTHFFRQIEEIDPLISIETFNKIQVLMRDRCHSHRQYEPMLIKDVKNFKIDFKKVKVIPVINRAKHNYNF
ncbi:hypothetical protein ES702_07160 [subsurface metagenome]